MLSGGHMRSVISEVIPEENSGADELSLRVSSSHNFAMNVDTGDKNPSSPQNQIEKE
jgi:hypothetical protein